MHISIPKKFATRKMGSYSFRRSQRWCTNPPLAPLIEGPTSSDDQLQEDGTYRNIKKDSLSPWESIRDWFRFNNNVTSPPYSATISNLSPKYQDLKLLLGVLGCPLAPIPVSNYRSSDDHHLRIKDAPIETSTAKYIIQQYMAATGCLKERRTSIKNMYTTGTVKMICCETEVSTGKGVKSLGSRSGSSESAGCFIIWQMSPGMWSLELCVSGNKVVAGSNGNTVWRHTPWLGTHAAKGPSRLLRRFIQGLDPKSTASLFTNAQCLGEKLIGDEDCFVLKVAADQSLLKDRIEGGAEVIRHVLYGYFSQKSGLLIYMEDSHLTRVQQLSGEDDTVYWETTIGSSIGDYRDVDGVMIAHQGRTIATVFRFEEFSMKHSRTRMEEMWTIDDVVFNVHGLSIDYFIPPADIFDT